MYLLKANKKKLKKINSNKELIKEIGIARFLTAFLAFRFKHIDGIALYPFAILKKPTEKLIKHELKHLKQQKKGLTSFLLKYSAEFLINCLRYKFNIKKAYLNISYEKN